MTLFTLGTKEKLAGRQVFKTMMVYLGISVFCLLFNYVYGIFGHGVTSVSMTWMFMYPFLGGTFVFLLMWLLDPEADKGRYYRFFYNIYNSGIAVLVVGSILKGVFEIAGTSSPFTIFYSLFGWIFVIGAALGFLLKNKMNKAAADPAVKTLNN